MRTFRGINLKLLTPELIPVLRPMAEWTPPASRALARSIERKNNPAAVVTPPPETPPQPNPATEFLDTQFRIKHGAVNSKQLAFSNSLIPDNTTVTLTAPAISGTISVAGAMGIHDHSNAANGGNIPEASITDGTLLARLAANETVSGLWYFDGGCRIEDRNDDPPTPAVGQIWLRTDL